MRIVELVKASNNKIGRVNKNGVKLYPHEDSTALHLAQFGFDIEYIMPSHIYKSTNPDFLVNGTIWETKSPEGCGKNTIKHQFDGTSKQADKLILDLRRIKLPSDKAERQAKDRFEKAVNIKRMLLITKDGPCFLIRRKMRVCYAYIMENKNKNTLINNNNIKSHKNRIKNWSAYNAGLVNRGNFTFLIEKSLLESPKQTGRAGHPFVYPDALIMVLAELREFTQLPFRQLVGLAKGLAGFAHVKLPSYSALCKRMSKLCIPSNIDSRQLDDGFFFLVDSTGLKTDGEGEWFRHKHGKHEKRGWIKLHIGIDYKSEQIVAHEATLENVADEKILPELVDATKNKDKIGQIIGDGAYTHHKLYQQIEEERGISLLAPPHRNAKAHMSFEHGHAGRRCSGGNYAKLIDDPGWKTHNKYVRGVIRLGLGKWKDEVGYHKRSLVETTMYRLKTAFSGKLKSRKSKNRKVEIAIRISLLNRWTTQSLPTYT